MQGCPGHPSAVPGTSQARERKSGQMSGTWRGKSSEFTGPVDGEERKWQEDEVVKV